jgi:hypothetical protein
LLDFLAVFHFEMLDLRAPHLTRAGSSALIRSAVLSSEHRRSFTQSDNALGDANVGVGQVEPVLFDVVYALVDIYTLFGLISRHLHYLESTPRPILTRKIGGGAIFRGAENATDAPENVNLHECSPDRASKHTISAVTTRQPSRPQISN